MSATSLPPTLTLLVHVLVRTKHSICAMYFAISFFVYVTVSRSDLRAAQMYAPSVVPIIQAALALLHILGLYQSACRRHASHGMFPPAKQQDRPRHHRRRWHLSTSFKLALFHCVDVGCVSYQAYRMAKYLVDRRLSVIYACVSSLYCLVTPWFLFVTHETVRTSTVLFLNAFLGNDAKAVTANLLVARYAVVSSPVDLATKALLQLGSLLNLRRLARSVESMQDGVTVAPTMSSIHPSAIAATDLQPSTRVYTPPQVSNQGLIMGKRNSGRIKFDLYTRRRFLQLFLASNCVWGVVLVVIAVTASYGREPCPPTCVHFVSPWADSKCHCVHVEVNCARLGIDGDNVTEYLRGDLIGPSLLNVEFSQCALTHGIPLASLSPHGGLSGIFISHSQMRDWAIDAASVNVLPDTITAFHIRSSALTEVPDFLAVAPRELVFLRLEGSPIDSIPDRFFQAWVNVSSLSLSKLLITEVSMNITNMLQLSWLELRGNRISSISTRWQVELIRHMHGLKWIDLSANLLELGPWDLVRVGATLELSSNPLHDCPPSWVIETGAIAAGTVVLDDTPCCNSSAAVAPACRPKCARQCLSRLIHDYRCDAVCYLPSCNFDGGDCDGMETFLL